MSSVIIVPSSDKKGDTKDNFNRGLALGVAPFIGYQAGKRKSSINMDAIRKALKKVTFKAIKK